MSKTICIFRYETTDQTSPLERFIACFDHCWNCTNNQINIKLTMKRIAIILLLGITVFFTSCEKESNPLEIKYEVKCDHYYCYITYQDESGYLRTVESTDFDWEYTFNAKSGDQLYIMVEGPDPYAQIEATIYINGNKTAHDEAAGYNATTTARIVAYTPKD